jgi:hypothetical protein
MLGLSGVPDHKGNERAKIPKRPRNLHAVEAVGALGRNSATEKRTIGPDRFRDGSNWPIMPASSCSRM